MKANMPSQEHLAGAKVPNTFLTSKAPLNEQGHCEYITCNLRSSWFRSPHNEEFMAGSVNLYVELHSLFGDMVTNS
jgi:hypothetical protein